jgi:hypothetical protein
MAKEPSPGKTDRKSMISLFDIVTTGPQQQLLPIKEAWEKDGKQSPDVYRNAIRQIHSINNGASNAFLVDATTAQDCISASLSVLAGWHSADTPVPVNTTKPLRGSHWMVAYLGAGPSTPTWWTVESVVVAKDKVILRYKASKPSPATADVRPYMYWIPLGKLASGTYELQLLDADRGSVTLLRRVEVSDIGVRGSTR